MKKGLSKWIVFGLLLALVLMLCACDLTPTNSTNNNQEETQKTEKKVELSQAVANYDEQDVKRIDATANATVSFYLAPSGSNNKEADKRDIPVKMGVSRVVDGDTYYDKAELLPNGKADDNVIGVFYAVQDTLAKTGGVVNVSPKVVQYVGFIIDFLGDKITAEAEIGVKGDTCNLKAEYENTGSDRRTEDVWCVFNAKEAGDLVGLDIQTEILAKTLLSDSLLGKIDLKNTTDSASNRVNKDGIGSYDIQLNAEVYKESIAAKVLSYLTDFGVELNEAKTAALKSAMNTVKKWIKVSPTTLTALVNKDKLPQKMNLETKINLDINFNEFRNMLNNLAAVGFLEEDMAKGINRAVWLASTYTRSSENEDGYIGIELKVNLEEKFAYGKEKCDTAKVDQDLYLAEDADAEGRIKLMEKLQKVTEENVDDLIEKALLLYNTANVTVADIVAEIKEELDFSAEAELSFSDVLEAAKTVCARHDIKLKIKTNGKADNDESNSQPEE